MWSSLKRLQRQFIKSSYIVKSSLFSIHRRIRDFRLSVIILCTFLFLCYKNRCADVTLKRFALLLHYMNGRGFGCKNVAFTCSHSPVKSFHIKARKKHLWFLP
jgi:hypothetical protein